ncbi:hypothetical protein GCM10018966_028170 [Streptomyces yanii]
MSDAAAVLDDLRNESDELDTLVAELSGDQWAGSTPAAGWSVAHQVAHLTWTDEVALLAATDPDAFAVEVAKAQAAPDSFVDQAAEELVAVEPAALLARWRDGRERLGRALRDAPPGTRIPWYGPPMSVASMATRATHGDLGPRAGHRRRPRRRTRPDRPAAARRPDRGAGP